MNCGSGYIYHLFSIDKYSIESESSEIYVYDHDHSEFQRRKMFATQNENTTFISTCGREAIISKYEIDRYICQCLKG